MIVNLSDLVPEKYVPFYQSTARYRIAKGARRSLKSTIVATNYVQDIIQHDNFNALVLRQNSSDIGSTLIRTFENVMNRLGVRQYFRLWKQPLKFEYLPTGNLIDFNGMNNIDNLRGYSFTHGGFHRLWIDELEQTKEIDFDAINYGFDLLEGGSDQFNQVTATFNPIDEHFWGKRRFFDKPSADTFSETFTIFDNPFLDSDTRAAFEQLKSYNPDRYRVEALGQWGSTGNNVFIFSEYEYKDLHALRKLCGVDLGFGNDPTAISTAYVDFDNKELWIDSVKYFYHQTIPELADELHKVTGVDFINIDTNFPQTNAELIRLGLPLRPVKKGKGSIETGISKMNEFKIHIKSSQLEVIGEFAGYKRDERGNIVQTHDHGIDASRYALNYYLMLKL